MTSVPRPENIGDIYRVHDYRFPGDVCYGAAYRGDFCQVSYINGAEVRKWGWFIEMDDGDLYVWPVDDGPDIPGSPRIELVRRNPLPPRDLT